MSTNIVTGRIASRKQSSMQIVNLLESSLKTVYTEVITGMSLFLCLAAFWLGSAFMFLGYCKTVTPSALRESYNCSIMDAF